MKKRSKTPKTNKSLREEIIGLGDRSVSKSYYPQLQEQIRLLQEAKKRAEESEENVRLLMETASDMIYRMSVPDGKYEYVSPASVSIFGYTPEEFYAAPFMIRKVIYPDWHGYFEEQWTKLLTGDMPPFYEYQIIHKSGEVRWVHQRNSLIKDDRGQPSAILGIVTDITERKKAEKTIKNTVSFLNSIIEQSPYSIWISDENGTLIRMNQACARLLNVTADELVGKYNVLKDTIVEEQGLMPLVKAVFEKGRTVHFEITYDSSQLKHLHLKRIALVVLQVTIFPIRDTKGKITNAVIQHMDITERKKAEEKIKRLNRLYIVLSKTAEAILRIRDIKELYSEACRIAIEEGLLRMSWIGFVDPDSQFIKPFAHYGHEEGYLKHIRISINADIPEGRGPTGTSIREGKYFICNDIEHDMHMLPWRDEAIKRGYRSSASFPLIIGGRQIGSLNLYAPEPNYFKEEEVKLFETLATDISFAKESIEHEENRKQAEDALRESEERWKFALEGAGDGVWDWNAQTNEVFFSRRWKEMLGYEEHEIGNTLDEWDKRVHPDDKKMVYGEIEKHFRGETDVYVSEHRVLCKDGTYKWILDRGKIIKRTDEGKPLRVIGTHTDITERKRAEEELRASEKRYHSLFDNMLEGFAYCRMFFDGDQPQDYVYLDVNQAFEQLTGLKNIVGKRVTEVIPGIRESDPELFASLGRVALTGKPERFEIYLESMGMWFSLSVYSPEEEYFVAMFDVITDRKKAEMALKESEDKFKRIFESANVGKSVTLPSGEITVNKAFADMVGYSQEELGTKTWQDLTPPDEIEAVQKMLVPLLNGEQDSTRFNKRYIHKNGSHIWADVSVAIQHDLEGKSLHFITTIVDITERKQAEDKLRASEATVRKKLDAIIEPEGDIGTLELSDIIDTKLLQTILEDFYRLTGMLGAILDTSGNILVAVGWQDICTKFHRCHPETNKNCIESDTILTHGVPPGSFKAYQCKNYMWDMVTPLMVGGRHVGNVFIGQFFYEDEMPDVELFREQARKYGFDETEYLAALDRVPRFRKETVDTCMQFYAKLAGIISTLSFSAIQQSRLLAERKKADDELRKHREHLEDLVKERTAELEQANERLKELDRLKSMFIASMSHELRTPLNSVIGFSSILMKDWVGTLNDEQKNMSSIILKAGKHLLSLINDVIDVSKIEAGMIDIHHDDFDIDDVITDAVESLAKEIEGKGLDLQVQTIHQQMHSDRGRLLQCILNLLSNAAKFTDKGSITVQTRIVNSEQYSVNSKKLNTDDNLLTTDIDFVEISVSDTGIGIQEEDIPKLFQAFVRLETPLKVVIPGTGLGLYLTRKLVTEVLQGDITVESEYGKGSRFIIKIPISVNSEK